MVVKIVGSAQKESKNYHYLMEWNVEQKKTKLLIKNVLKPQLKMNQKKYAVEQRRRFDVPEVSIFLSRQCVGVRRCTSFHIKGSCKNIGDSEPVVSLVATAEVCR